MQGTTNSQPAPTFPNWDSGVYSLLSTLVWILLALILLYVFRDVVKRLIKGLTRRLEDGALIKIWNIELGPLRISQNLPPENSSIKARVDALQEKEREGIYTSNHRLFVVHRLFPSSIDGQLYDILIYVIPHKGRNEGNLDEVTQVDYYFGSAWGHKVFSSMDRGKRFAIVASAYGAGFLCFARIYLRDGNSYTTWRYIDFETGTLGSES
jgi:hypothetical protein